MSSWYKEHVVATVPWNQGKELVFRVTPVALSRRCVTFTLKSQDGLAGQSFGVPLNRIDAVVSALIQAKTTSERLNAERSASTKPKLTGNAAKAACKEALELLSKGGPVDLEVLKQVLKGTTQAS